MKFNIGSIFNRKGSAQKINITSINIKWRGSSHAMQGMEVKEKRFTITVPFQNKTQQDALPFEALKERLKAQQAPPITISKIDVSDPFKLVSVEPNLPKSVQSGERAEFKIAIEAPDYTYAGPLTLSISADEVSMIKVQINKVILKTSTKSAEIENSGVILNMPRGNIFKNSVQMYKALTYGNTVRKVTISKPFEFVSCDPNIPFTIDDRNSYLVTFYIKGPDIDYAGPMEITVE